MSIELDGEYLVPIAGRDIPTTEGDLVSVPDGAPWIVARGDHIGWVDADGGMRVGVVKDSSATVDGERMIELVELERFDEVQELGDEGERR